MTTMHKLTKLALLLPSVFLAACENDAQVVSKNLSQAADSAAGASPFHYRVVFKPTTIIPNIELR